MITLIKMNLKQKFKSSLTWFVALVLCIVSMLNIIEMRNIRLNRTFEGHDINSWGSGNTFDWTQHLGEDEIKLYPKAYYAARMKNTIEKSLIEANEENNIKEINRLMSFYHLLWAKEGYVADDPIINNVFERKVLDIWDDTSGGIAYDEIDFRPFNSNFGTGDYHLLLAKYYYQLYIDDLEPIYLDDINNITYLYNYFYNIVPKFIVIAALLFTYDIINKEKRAGSLKLILTQSIPRWSHYISKWISGTIQTTLTILFPATVISTILGFKNGFVPLKHPVLYLEGTLSSFKPIPNYMDALKSEIGYYPRFASVFYCYAPTNSKFSTAVGYGKSEIIPFYKYLLMVILLTILFIAFAVALVQLISAIIDKEIISFVAVSGVFIIGILLSSPFKYGKHFNLSPFTMENASRIVTGIYNVTALTSILILSLSTILLLGIGVRYFKRKEVL